MHGTNKRHSMSISSHGEQRWGARTVDGPPARPTDRPTDHSNANEQQRRQQQQQRTKRTKRTKRQRSERSKRTNERTKSAFTEQDIFVFPYPGISHTCFVTVILSLSRNIRTTPCSLSARQPLAWAWLGKSVGDVGGEVVWTQSEQSKQSTSQE